MWRCTGWPKGGIKQQRKREIKGRHMGNFMCLCKVMHMCDYMHRWKNKNRNEWPSKSIPGRYPCYSKLSTCWFIWLHPSDWPRTEEKGEVLFRHGTLEEVEQVKTEYGNRWVFETWRDPEMGKHRHLCSTWHLTAVCPFGNSDVLVPNWVEEILTYITHYVHFYKRAHKSMLHLTFIGNWVPSKLGQHQAVHYLSLMKYSLKLWLLGQSGSLPTGSFPKFRMRSSCGGGKCLEREQRLYRWLVRAWFLLEDICTWGFLLFSAKKQDFQFSVKCLELIASAMNLTVHKFLLVKHKN